MNIHNLPALVMRQAQKRQTQRQQQRAWRNRLGRGRYDDLVKEIYGIIRAELEEARILTAFGLEGPLRHRIRSDLCLMRWQWDAADRMALDLLGDAFAALGATRPSWHEGQLEWTVEAGTLIERTHCAQCHKPLPEDCHKFCSRGCMMQRANANYHARHHFEGRVTSQLRIANGG